MRGPMPKRILATVAIVTMLQALTVAGCATPVPEKQALELRVGVADLGDTDKTVDPMVLTLNGTPLVCHVFDNIFELTEAGALAPGIAKKWEIAPDGRSWTLYLRDDVFFQDGKNADGTVEPARKMTAADVAFSYQKSVAEINYQNKNWKDLLGAQPRVDVLDEYSLRVYTNGPQPNFAIFSSNREPAMWVLPKAYIEKNGQPYFASNPIGTGPYKLVKTVAGDRLEFQAVANNWRGKPQFERVVLYQIPEETTRVAMLEKGQLDITPVGLQNAGVLKGKGFNIQKGVAGQAQFIFMGTYTPQAKGMPLADVRVRQALSLAINREEILNTLFGGIGAWPSFLRLGWENADLTPALREKWIAWSKVNYRYDPAEAKRLLKEAGYGAGVTFELWLPPDSSAPYLADVVTACVNYWAQVGITAKVTLVDSAAWTSNKLVKKSPKLIGYAVANGSPMANPSSVRQMDWYTSVGTADLLYGSPLEVEMDALYKEGYSTMDLSRLEKILDKMIEINVSTWTGFGVAGAPLTFAFGPRVNGSIPPWTKSFSRFYAAMTYTGK